MLGLTNEQVNSLPKEKCIGITYTNSIQELAEYYSAADVFINPTLEDNFPTTNIEALTCGTPIITFNTGGSVEVIDETTGFVVEQGDVSAMRNVVRIVLQQVKEHYQKNCRDKAVNLYEKGKQYMKYVELYKQLIK